MGSNLSGPDHRQTVRDSKYLGRQTRYRGDENRVGVVTGFERNARKVWWYFHQKAWVETAKNRAF